MAVYHPEYDFYIPKGELAFSVGGQQPNVSAIENRQVSEAVVVFENDHVVD